jgi:hypothetical protein
MKGLKLVIKFGGNRLKKLKSQTFSDMKLPEKSEKKGKWYNDFATWPRGLPETLEALSNMTEQRLWPDQRIFDKGTPGHSEALWADAIVL